MGMLSAFEFISLDGFFEGSDGDIGWFPHGEEQREYALAGLCSGGAILFGRKTYELMAKYWPTPPAMEHDPVMAEAMNRAEKIVFSRSLQKAGWRNTRLVKDEIGDEIRKLKLESGKDMTILGSGSIVSQCAQLDVIDEYQIVVAPVVLGSGTPLFRGITQPFNLKLIDTRTFTNGSVLLRYRPDKNG